MKNKPVHKTLSLAIGAWLIAGACLGQTTLSPAPVVAEIESNLFMSLRFSRINTTTHDTLSTLDPHTDRLINEMLECLSTGDFDEVGMIAFVHKIVEVGLTWWDTTYLVVTYDGGGYDTCNWVRWQTGWRYPYVGSWTYIYYYYLLPGTMLTPGILDEAYATETELGLQMGFGDSLALTWSYVQSARPE